MSSVFAAPRTGRGAESLAKGAGEVRGILKPQRIAKLGDTRGLTGRTAQLHSRAPQPAVPDRTADRPAAACEQRVEMAPADAQPLSQLFGRERAGEFHLDDRQGTLNQRRLRARALALFRAAEQFEQRALRMKPVPSRNASARRASDMTKSSNSASSAWSLPRATAVHRSMPRWRATTAERGNCTRICRCAPDISSENGC